MNARIHHDAPALCPECYGAGTIEVEDYGIFGGPGSAHVIVCRDCEGVGYQQPEVEYDVSDTLPCPGPRDTLPAPELERCV